MSYFVYCSTLTEELKANQEINKGKTDTLRGMK